MDGNTVAFDPLSAYNQRLLERAHHSGLRQLRIVTDRGACEACSGHHGVYDVGQVPPLPLAGCTSNEGCRCFYALLDCSRQRDSGAVAQARSHL